MPNPVTSEPRDTVVTLDNGVIGKLRIGDTLQQTIRRHKPGHLGFGDFALKAMYDEILMRWIIEGRYEDVHATIAADWGLGTTDVAAHHERSDEARKPGAKAAR